MIDPLSISDHYAGLVRDPDGNRIEAPIRRPEEQS